jgi:BlaI family penicillinase repressor
MKILWEAEKPVATGTICRELAEKLSWDRSTVRTLLRRLTEKGAVEEIKMQVLCYLPAISETEYLDTQTKSFLERLYGGNAKKLIASLIQSDRLSQGDIEELREYLNQGGEGQ